MVVCGGEEDGENYILGNIPGTYQQYDLVLEAISSSDYENGNANGKKWSFGENDQHSVYRHLDLVF